MRQEPEMFKKDRKEYEKFLKEFPRRTRGPNSNNDWTNIIGSISLALGIGCFGVFILVKILNFFRSVQTSIKMPTLAFEEMTLILGVVALIPWIAITIYKKHYSKDQNLGAKRQ